MFFKLTYTIKPLDLGTTTNLQFDLKFKDEVVHIELQKVFETEASKRFELGDIKTIAKMDVLVSDKRKKLFKEITDKVPVGLEQFISDIRDALSLSIVQTIRNIRWRQGLSESHNFVRYGGSLNWSFDGTQWYVFPGETRINLNASFAVNKEISLADIDALQEQILNGTTEPLAHELFCEAWAQRETNPRSALVLGMAAVETGFKECVTKLMPQATWLVENTQSPLLTKMLREFLPTLPAKNSIRGKIVPPPEYILKEILDGITIRNKIVHGKYVEVKKDKLEKVLKAIRDVLYLMDYYCGYSWADRNISIETIKSLISDADKIS